MTANRKKRKKLRRLLLKRFPNSTRPTPLSAAAGSWSTKNDSPQAPKDRASNPYREAYFGAPKLPRLGLNGPEFVISTPIGARTNCKKKKPNKSN